MTRRPPLATREGVRLALRSAPFDNRKARSELSADPVMVVEGEKAADACVERGILAVTNAGGSSQTAFGKALEILK